MEILKAQFHAQALGDSAVAAYWSEKMPEYHKEQMIRSLKKIAEAMGFEVVPLQEQPEDATLDT